MLTKDDLKAVRELFRPVESDVRDLRRKMDLLDRKVERVESNLQKAINRTVDVFDDEITRLKERMDQVEKHLKFSSI